MNLHSTRSDLSDAVASTRIIAEDAYLLQGHSKKISEQRPLIIQDVGGLPRVVAEMASDLYTQVYTRPGPIPPILPDRTSMQMFCERLSQANVGNGMETPGLRQVAAIGREVIVEDLAGRRKTAPAAQFVPDEDGTGFIRRPKDAYKRESSFYYALPDYEPPLADYSSAVRIYFSVCNQGAHKLVNAVTQTFNNAQIPFRFKIVKDPLKYYRADRSVLYVRPEDWVRAAPAIHSIWKECRRYLVNKRPAFTKRLAPGISLAESPRTTGQESFGSHRCRLIAEGMWHAYQDGQTHDEGVLAIVSEHLTSVGLDLDHLYLDGGTHDPY